MPKLRVVPMAFAMGISWGFGIMLLGWLAGGGWGVRVVEVLASFYRGYAPTFAGGVIGGLWGFGDGFLGGVVLTALYNAFGGAPRERDARGASTRERGAGALIGRN